MNVVYFLLFSFVCPYDVVPSKPKHGERIFRWPLLLDKLSTTIQKSFLHSKDIINMRDDHWGQISCSTIRVVVCRRKRILIVVEGGPEPRFNHWYVTGYIKRFIILLSSCDYLAKNSKGSIYWVLAPFHVHYSRQTYPWTILCIHFEAAKLRRQWQQERSPKKPCTKYRSQLHPLLPKGSGCISVNNAVDQTIGQSASFTTPGFFEMCQVLRFEIFLQCYGLACAICRFEK